MLKIVLKNIKFTQTFTNEGDKEIIELYAKALEKKYMKIEVLLKMGRR